MWRFLIYLSTWSHNPGNKMVRCGVITVSLFFGLIIAGERYHFPAGVFVAGLIIVLAMALITLSFAVVRIVNFCRNRRRVRNV